MHEIEASLKEVKFTQEGKLLSRTLDGLKKNLKMPNKVKITSFFEARYKRPVRKLCHVGKKSTLLMKTNLLLFCAIFFLIHIAIYAQRAEVSVGVPVFNNVYVHFEKPISKWKNVSFTSSAAYKFHADNDIRFGELFFSSVIKSNSIRRTKFDVGLRAYLVKFDRQKWLNMYVGASFLVGKMSREFNDYRLNIPKDSLTQKAIYFGPEFTSGVKIIILKKITITPALGLAYLFKSVNSENISKKEELWYARDWFDGEILNRNNTESRRTNVINLGFGWTPNIYLNIGYKF